MRIAAWKAGVFVTVGALGFGCATSGSPTEDAFLPVSETNGAEDSVRLPPSGSNTNDAAADATAPPPASDAGSDAAKPPAGPQPITIKLTATQPTWIVDGAGVFIKVLKDAKNCNIFGNNCDQDVDLKIFIDAPSSLAASTPSCSLVQAGLGPRRCSEGASIAKTAMLSIGDDVTVRFVARADDPGADPNCGITKTWTFDGTGFSLKNEAFPASGLWQCTGGGSGQDLEVQLGMKLSL